MASDVCEGEVGWSCRSCPTSGDGQRLGLPDAIAAPAPYRSCDRCGGEMYISAWFLRNQWREWSNVDLAAWTVRCARKPGSGAYWRIADMREEADALQVVSAGNDGWAAIEQGRNPRWFRSQAEAEAFVEEFNDQRSWFADLAPA